MMHFIVDGHNALHRLRLRDGDIATLRGQLVTLVRQRIRRGAQVIFDGYPPSGAFGRTDDSGVDVRYAGKREADEEIVDVIRATHTPNRFVVVTDDIALARRVEQIGAQSLRVRDFFDDEDERNPGSRTDEAKPSGRRATAGFSAADFHLPDEIDLDHPPESVGPKSWRAFALRRGSKFPPK